MNPTTEILLFGARFLSSFYAPIQDCDEVFNYWEPLHYYMYGVGFQTWEYTTTYGLRSWAYILVHAYPLLAAEYLLELLTLTGVFDMISRFSIMRFILGTLERKAVLFYFLRRILGFASTSVEIYFLQMIELHVHKRIATFTAIGLIFSPGMFIASTAFIPSSFSLPFITLAFAASLDPVMSEGQVYTIIVCVVVAGILGWPFCLLFGAIFALIWMARGVFYKWFWSMVAGTIVAIAAITIPIFLVDTQFYNFKTLPSLNLVIYNVFSGGEKGPNLFGVEEWHFYIRNGFLNFNIFLFFAMSSLPILLCCGVNANEKLVLSLLPFYIWFITFSLQPHKEERFMFVIFQILPYNAAVGLHFTMELLERTMLRWKSLRRYAFTASSLLSRAVLAIFIFLSCARIYALVTFYGAPLEVYHALAWAPPPGAVNGWIDAGKPNVALFLGREVNVCVGKEWYRFPSHFLMPHGMKLAFLESRFRGLVPVLFPGGELNFTGQDVAGLAKEMRFGKREYAFVPKHNNDLNRYVADRFVDIGSCDYLVDSIPVDAELGKEDPIEPFYGLDPRWEVVSCAPFLDAANTPFPARAFYFGKKKWLNYCSYRRV